MGLRKSTRKFLGLIAFNFRFYQNIRYDNVNPENYANQIILHPGKKQKSSIPKIIWMYWDNNIPDIVQKCFDTVYDLHPEYQINILNSENIVNFCTLDFSQFRKLTPQQKSDLLRFYLLYKYGGIWLDASIILYEKLDWIIELCNINKTSAFAYYRAANVTNKKYPVLENWLLASEPNNIFFKKWLEELSLAFHTGIPQYIDNIRTEKANHQEYFQNIGMLEYLIAYVACQTVLRQTETSFTLINCDKNAFFYQNINLKSNTYFIEAMVLRNRPSQMPHLIKLIGSDRQLLTPYLLKNKYKKESLLDH